MAPSVCGSNRKPGRRACSQTVGFEPILRARLRTACAASCPLAGGSVFLLLKTTIRTSASVCGRTCAAVRRVRWRCHGSILAHSSGGPSRSATGGRAVAAAAAASAERLALEVRGVVAQPRQRFAVVQPVRRPRPLDDVLHRADPVAVDLASHAAARPRSTRFGSARTPGRCRAERCGAESRPVRRRCRRPRCLRS